MSISVLIVASIALLFNFSAYAQLKNNEIYGPVKAKENLWAIARAYKTPPMSMYKLTWAFFQQNKHAFYNDNMNRLKQGVYLKVPKSQQVSAISLEQSKRKVNQQIRDYEIFYKNYLKQQSQPNSQPLALVQHEQMHEKKTDKKRLKNNQTAAKDAEPTINLKQIAQIKQQLQVEHNNANATTKSTAKHIKIIVPHNDHSLRIIYSYDVSTSYDDNVRFAQLEADKRSDVLGLMVLKATTSLKLSQASRLKLSAKLSKEWYQVFNKLNHLDYSFDTAYIFSNEFKFNSPVYVAKLSIGGSNSNSEMRTANIYSVGFNRNERWSNLIHTTVGLKYKAQDSQSEVYDTKAFSLFANVDYTLDNRSILYTTYHFIKGDQVSSATPNLGVINASDAIEPDDAFGGVAKNQFAYKIDSNTHVLTVGYNKRTSRKVSLDFSARYVNSHAISNETIKYERWIFNAGILGRF